VVARRLLRRGLRTEAVAGATKQVGSKKASARRSRGRQEGRCSPEQEGAKCESEAGGASRRYEVILSFPIPFQLI